MARVSDPFGPRTHPITGAKSFHTGVDLAAPIGTPIYASKPLTVVQSGYQYNAAKGTGYGNYVIVEDPATGTRYKYAHLDEKPNVKAGDSIKSGQEIGYTGNSGGSTGAHLHHEVLVDGKPVDPQKMDSVSSFTKGQGTLFTEPAIPSKNRRPSTGTNPAPAPGQKPAPGAVAPKAAPPTNPAPRTIRMPSSMSPLHNIHDTN